MQFSSITSLEKRKAADVVVLPFWQGEKEAAEAASFRSLKETIRGPIRAHDFLGKEGEITVVYTGDKLESRIALLGLGPKDKVTAESLRRAYSGLVKWCHNKKIKKVNLLLPIAPLLEVVLVRSVCEGLFLSNYAFDSLKGLSKKEDPTVLIQSVALVGAGQQSLAIANKTLAICKATFLARDLVNGNADDVTPQHLVKVANDLAKSHASIKTTVLGKKQLEKEGFGLLLAVNRGSSCDPALIILQYRGQPHSNNNTVIVGKGITYDTGGLNLKVGVGMETMKCDMGGAAAVLGTMLAAATLGLKTNLTGVIATTENSIGPDSYKPGDVYTSYLGKTVEIGNTDAEGRLVLADALAYANAKLAPTRMINLATLTGSIVIALGEEATGLMSNSDELSLALSEAGETTYERVWRMPLYDEYQERLKSDFADLINVAGRPASANLAGMFLKEFVGKTPWAHLDIAGTAYLTKARHYLPKNATGVGVRLLIEFLEQGIKK